MIADPSYGTQSDYGRQVSFRWVHSNSTSTATCAGTGDWYPQVVVIEAHSSNWPEPKPRRRLRYEPPPLAPWERERLSRESFLRGLPGIECRAKRSLRASVRAKHRRECRWHPNQEHPTRPSAER